MVSIEQAELLIQENISKGKVENRELTKSLGYVLATDVISQINMPPFAQSAMDGYAISVDESSSLNQEFKVIAEQKAGDSEIRKVARGEAVRIYTGAMIPLGCNCVIAQEDIIHVENGVFCHNVPSEGTNIRLAGEQIKQGEIALQKGSVLNPASMGFLATLGFSKVNVFSKPHITLIISGSELISADEELIPGKIYESNSVSIGAAVEQANFNLEKIITVPDDEDESFRVINDAIEQSDIVILSGGISVGDYDFTGKALQKIGVKELFYKINQKPGKPMYYGKIDNCNIFALPGNPAAALVCFYMYVEPALKIFSGYSTAIFEKIKYPLAEAFHNYNNRALLLKSRLVNNEIIILGSQSSAMLNSFSESNCLTEIPPEVSLKKGDLVRVTLLD